jgi:hypothetical protein
MTTASLLSIASATATMTKARTSNGSRRRSSPFSSIRVEGGRGTLCRVPAEGPCTSADQRLYVGIGW